MPTLLSRATAKALPTSRTMRYEVVEAAGSHVLRDVLLDDFCTLPDLAGQPVLLAFPSAYQARLWLMTADTRRARAATEARIRAQQRKRPTKAQVQLLRFGLYLPQDSSAE
ncbi:hypothetical protein CFP65_4062 [Kitasatospora sp. MMS16-BH015]|uniref:hypothetical protein n=1 Tax=Kitasatospora sp. MMS16-BH015 TaxID=2018025 RepID=UPI000CA0F475|nr:hypothetical protein [Kitasatospora sp. MMS16-BH015]AUG78828.1 hypothetical protein CFP65_4062 [Kitasatospora sp. MMS16-BH015]